jgi:uncharacterized protein (DUF2164 family)
MPFPAAEKQRIVETIQRYMADELGQDIGRFDAEFLLDFLAGALGPHFYNHGLRDAQAILAARIDDVQDAIMQLEKPIGHRR